MAVANLGRELLVASVGVATVSYVACASETSGNLMGFPPCDAGGYCPDTSDEGQDVIESGDTDAGPDIDAETDAETKDG